MTLGWYFFGFFGFGMGTMSILLQLWEELPRTYQWVAEMQASLLALGWKWWDSSTRFALKPAEKLVQLVLAEKLSTSLSVSDNGPWTVCLGAAQLLAHLLAVLGRFGGQRIHNILVNFMVDILGSFLGIHNNLPQESWILRSALSLKTFDLLYLIVIYNLCDSWTKVWI